MSGLLVLDSGGLSRLARPGQRSDALIGSLRVAGLWPPLVPSAVIVESLTGRPGRDVNTNRLLGLCAVVTSLPLPTARRAAALRHASRRGSAVDAIVVALAEPGGTVLTGDLEDIEALAGHAVRVGVERV
jgi:hypothetical protein